MTPIDIITNEVRLAVRQGDDVRHLAEVMAAALDNLHIIGNAVEALKADGWEETPEGPMGIYRMSDEDLTNIAVTVLRSVAGQ